MSYYLHRISEKYGTHVWKVEEDRAFRIGVPNPENHKGSSYFERMSGKTIWETIQAQTDWFGPAGQNPFQKAVLQPGQYYPRMARPLEQHGRTGAGSCPGAKNESSVTAIALSQLNVFTRQLDRICQTVHPTPQTFGAYGHDIRNLLIIACTEVESYWRGVLVANGVKRDRYSTNDYVALLKPMRLDEYELKFVNYPWLPPIRPFLGWGSTGKPTQDLKWYDAYNAVKHDRESHFERATLQSTFEAVCACVVMMAAQFGLHEGFGHHSDVASFFRVSAQPTWDLTEMYIYPYDGFATGWSSVTFPFAVQPS
jgi:hypothetical protein